MLGKPSDAAGHNRRWHLLLMVTPAHGRPWGQVRAPGPGAGEKRQREEREKREKKWRNLLGCFFNYTCKFEKSRKDEAQETGLSFALPIFLKISHFKMSFLDGSSVTTNALYGHDTNIQLT